MDNQRIFDQRITFVRPSLPKLSELADQLRETLTSGVLTKGPQLSLFEEQLAAHLGVKHAVAVSSCTSGLMLTYQALGISGEVIVPSFTFLATVAALRWCGARPVFADIDKRTMNLDPNAAEAAITPRTAAIVAVHNFGAPAEINALQAVADRHGLHLIFDAAHGFGSLFSGEPLGRHGDAEVFSMAPTKLLIAGEGGVVATNNDHLAQTIRIGREYGNDGHYNSAFAGMNARLSELHALVGLRSLQRLENAARARNRVAEYYRERLGRLPGLSFQLTGNGDRSSYTCFPVVVEPEFFELTRDELAAALAVRNIETRRYYYPPVHQQTAYREFTRTSLANTEAVSSRVLSLPVWSEMETEIVSAICNAVEQVHELACENPQKRSAFAG